MGQWNHLNSNSPALRAGWVGFFLKSVWWCSYLQEPCRLPAFSYFVVFSMFLGINLWVVGMLWLHSHKIREVCAEVQACFFVLYTITAVKQKQKSENAISLIPGFVLPSVAPPLHSFISSLKHRCSLLMSQVGGAKFGLCVYEQQLTNSTHSAFKIRFCVIPSGLPKAGQSLGWTSGSKSWKGPPDWDRAAPLPSRCSLPLHHTTLLMEYPLQYTHTQSPQHLFNLLKM